MTILIAHRSVDHAFLAADSVRWDLKQQRNLAPVSKIHLAGSRSAVALGGVNIDRTRLADLLVSARQAGEGFADAARRITPELFAETRGIMTRERISGEQRVVSLYAETGPQGCTIACHRLPEDSIEAVGSFDFHGPDRRWLFGQAAAAIRQHHRGGQIALDELTMDLIGRAAARYPRHVGFPAMMLMLRRDGTQILRQDMDIATWTGPLPDFTVGLDL